MGGGLCVSQEHGDRVGLGRHLSPTLHPQVGTGVAAAHVEGKAGFPGRCPRGLGVCCRDPSALCVAEREAGWLHPFLPDV